jgi:hypothetical protein
LGDQTRRLLVRQEEGRREEEEVTSVAQN